MFATQVVGSFLKCSPQKDVLPAELEFYQSYDWSLNPYPTVGEAIAHLREEVDKLAIVPEGWQIGEVATNIFLLSCGLLNCIDGYLRGPALHQVLANVVGRRATRLVETISERPWSRLRYARWRENCLSDLNNFLSLIVARQAFDATSLAESARRLTIRLGSQLPTELQAKRLGTPSPFSHLDLTPSDVLKLGDCFARRFPDRAQPILLVGLRTSGSYFAPLLRALLGTEGYSSVEFLTIEPIKGVGRREERKLKRFAARGYWALIVDDPPDTNRTLLAALDIVHRAGFAHGSVKFLAPTHPAKPTWFKAFPEDCVITLEPTQWYKMGLLNAKVVELHLTEYFRAQNFTRVSVTASWHAQEFNADLQSIASDERGVRLKRVFEVELETLEGEKQTKHVLAKSVGWGWLSYRAFLAGHRLSGHVPPILGLRDGILYMEWIPQPGVELSGKRREIMEASASYVAARVRHLNLKTGSGMDLQRHNNGSRLLAKTLSRAYGRFPMDMLMRTRLRRLVEERQCPRPTLIDGNMHRDEWIMGPQGLLKTDYEHHGMGKTALNVIDPAYDLAETILDLALSSEDERNLVKRYIAESGDCAVEQRLFMYKLLSGLWVMCQTQEQLFASPRGGDAQRDYHRRFMNAWDFLTTHTARHCGSLCYSRTEPRWSSPLVVLDIDGVLDRRLFGFPSTTVAGMKALSLLNAHEFSVAVNTARSAAEVKDYCNAYSLAGGVAEHGSYLWDAVHQRERVLISAETIDQLEELRQQLGRIPGVFLDERHRYSIRAFTYRDKPLGLIRSLLNSSGVGAGVLAPISTHMVHQLLVDRRLDRLTFHHTTIDTAIVAKEVDKGAGLAALRDWVLAADAETIAIGDSEPDLAMFRVATRSFAPSNIDCKRLARLLGCRIASYSNQQGLLEIVRNIIHSENGRCARCSGGEMSPPPGDDLFLLALQAADQKWTTNLFRAITDPTAFKMFVR